jgi:lipopolysaccharide transport system ATP-binding protein
MDSLSLISLLGILSTMIIAFGGESHELPAGLVIGCIGASGAGISQLLRQSGGRHFGPLDLPDLSQGPMLALEYTLDLQDAFTRMQSEDAINTLRRSGTSALLASHDTSLLRRLADEIWWLDAGRVRQKGDPEELLRAYEKNVAERYRASGAGAISPIVPAMRRGDGRARLIRLETLDSAGGSTSVWRCGEIAQIRVVVGFNAAVADPVVGIMIRTRIGMEVYGTNTELENVSLGPCSSGDIRTITFAFECALCPQSYTITAASHDPDGVWHDWLEDAVAFSVTDNRYTAGVANLRARVTCSRG